MEQVGCGQNVMLAVQLHRTPKAHLSKGACLIPIIDWQSGKVQIRAWLKYATHDRYLTLARIPKKHPVRICFSYGNSNFIKAVSWPSDYKPLDEWPAEYIRAIAEWWDAPGWLNSQVEPGGLMADEPRLFLGQKLPESSVLWTKDLRLLYQRSASRKSMPSHSDN